MLLHARTLSLLIILLCGVAASAQDNESGSAPKTSYEVTLQLLVASNSAAQSDKLPASLAPVEKKLRSEFKNVNYNLGLSLLNRISDKGSLEIKGVSPFDQTDIGKSFSFYDFNLSNIKTNQNNEIQFDYLRFGMRVPVAVAGIEKDGKNSAVYNYEAIGINAKTLIVILDEPTIIGTMTTNRADESMILVLTVKPDSAAASRVARRKDARQN